MHRYFLSILFLFFHFAVLAQSDPAPNPGRPILSAAATISKYSIAQQRLLVVSTAQFINAITQNHLDKDSVLSMACHMTGMPFFLPYSEGFSNTASGGEHLIDSGRITEAIQLSKHLKGEQEIQLLLELGIWYLHQPGTRKKDLDSADAYIAKAAILSRAGNYIKWDTECRFLLGELYDQKGNASESREIFMQQVAAGQQEGNSETSARAYQYLGALLPARDSMKRVYYERALTLYRKLQSKEKEIELLWDISACDATIGATLMESDLQQMITLMQSIGFKHVLYAENHLAIALGRQGKYMDAFAHVSAAVQNMKWSGIDAFAGPIYIGFGAFYESIGKNDEALVWYKKGLDARKSETHMFWYKNFLYAASMLMNTNPTAALSLIDTITRQFPPQSVWEQLQILSIKGGSYEKLNKPGSADENYMSLLKLSNRYPSEDPYGELTNTYFLIANFYISRPNVNKARLFLKKATTNPQKSIDDDAIKYSLLYKLDSSEGNYKLAMQDHIKYKLYDDSLQSFDQRKQMDELTVKYAAEKKDQDIKLLTQQGKVQQGELKQNKLTRNIMIVGSILMSIIIILLFTQFRMKQRINKEMNQQNLALKQLVDEKEWLVKEVHHRVKNNLQTIISLLESQAAYLENDALKAIGTTQNRIYTMSLIHQKLYQSEDVKTIDMAVYIPELIKYLKDSFDISHKIDFNVHIDPVGLDPSIAIPLALIINEALTNSIKYAFPDNRHGQISISLREHGELLKLELADNGIGMDTSSNNANPVSLGLQLIKGLAKEIRGEVSLTSDRGVKITLLFKKSALEYANIL
jgi:two-component system, sensor histidine kinase PdtaS